MTPGSFLVVVGSDEDALRARSQGWHLRDTVLVLLPGGTSLTAFLFRQPLAHGFTVAENVARHGVGALWIDGCRVHSGPSSGGSISGVSALGQGSGWNPHNNSTTQIDRTIAAGRWPTNLVLVHGPGCRCLGERRVKGSVLGQVIERSKSKSDTYQRGKAQTDGYAHGYTDSDGTETVPDYDCEPGCPVRMLDESSGFLVGAGNVRDTMTPSAAKRVVYAGGWKDQSGNPNWYSNHGGGASRFYPQFPCLAEALDWLCRLAGLSDSA